MHVPFEMLPKNTRIWVYQSPSPIKEKILTPLFQKFCEEWMSHGNQLRCSFIWKDSYFLILGVDESFHPASGCSIDKSVHFLQTIEINYGQSFLRRDFLFVEKESTLHLLLHKNIKESIKNGFLKKIFILSILP